VWVYVVDGFEDVPETLKRGKDTRKYRNKGEKNERIEKKKIVNDVKIDRSINRKFIKRWLLLASLKRNYPQIDGYS